MTLVDGGVSSSTGNLGNDPERKRTDYIEVVPNVDYRTKNVDSIFFYTENKEFIERQLIQGVTPNNAKYMICRVLKTSIEPQFNYGTSLLPYKPYYDGYKISGKSCGKNLFKDLDSFVNRFIQAEIGRGILEETDATMETAIRITMTKVIEIKPNTDYIITCKNGYGLSFTLAGEDMKVTSAVTSWDNKYVLNNTNNYYLRLTFKRSDNANISPNETKDMEIQIEETSTESSYEPYQESNYSYILNEPLRSLPNRVCDEIDLTKGVLTRRVGKVVLDGSEKWNVASTEEKTIKFQLHSSYREQFKCKGSTVSISDSFPYIAGSDDIEHLRPDGGSPFANFLIWINKDRLSSLDLDGFKQWLQANPTTVIYELAEPTTEQLSPQQLKSFDETTHVISDNKLMPVVSTKIPSDVNAVVQNLKAENKNLEKQLDSAIEELNNTDIDLIAIDWETDYRLCELEWTLLDTMKVETLAESKVVENRILSRYEQAKILIESGKYNKSTMEKQLTMYYNRNYLTKEEFNELMELMNPIGEVETLEELDEVENI